MRSRHHTSRLAHPSLLTVCCLQVLDVFLAVDRLHALATHGLKKLTTKVEYEWRIVVQGAYLGQVDAKVVSDINLQPFVCSVAS